MKKNLSILVLVFIILVVSLLGLCGYLGYKSFMYSPQKVRVTNVTDRAATVSWVTDSLTKGTVFYSKENSFLPAFLPYIFSERGYDDRDYTVAQTKYLNRVNQNYDDYEYSEEDISVFRLGNYYVHHVTLKNLDPDTQYYFRVSDGFWSWDVDTVNQSVQEHEYPVVNEFTFSTFVALDSIPVPDPAYGRIIGVEYDDEGYMSSDDSIDSVIFAFLMDQDQSKVSLALSSVTNTSGGWSIDKANARYGDGSLATDFVEGDDFLAVYLQYENEDLTRMMAYSLGIEDTPVETLKGNDPDLREESIEEVESFLKRVFVRGVYAIPTSDFSLPPQNGDSGSYYDLAVCGDGYVTGHEKCDSDNDEGCSTNEVCNEYCSGCQVAQTIPSNESGSGGTTTSDVDDAVAEYEVFDYEGECNALPGYSWAEEKCVADSERAGVFEEGVSVAFSCSFPNCYEPTSGGYYKPIPNKDCRPAACANEYSRPWEVPEDGLLTSLVYCPNEEDQCSDGTCRSMYDGKKCPGEMVSCCIRGVEVEVEIGCCESPDYLITADNPCVGELVDCYIRSTEQVCTFAKRVAETLCDNTCPTSALETSTSYDNYCPSEYCINSSCAKILTPDGNKILNGENVNKYKILCEKDSILKAVFLEVCTGYDEVHKQLVNCEGVEGQNSFMAPDLFCCYKTDHTYLATRVTGNTSMQCSSGYQVLMGASMMQNPSCSSAIDSISLSDYINLPEATDVIIQELVVPEPLSVPTPEEIPIPQTTPTPPSSRLYNNFVYPIYAEEPNMKSIFYAPSAGIYKTSEDLEIYIDEDQLIFFYEERNGEAGYQLPEDIENIKDTDDLLYPFQYANLTIAPDTTIHEIHLKKGINIVSFPFLPKAPNSNVFYGSHIMAYANRYYINAESITSFENGMWSGGLQKTYDSEGNSTIMGVDFPITMGKGYLIVANKDFTLKLPGYDVETPVPVAYSAGWSLIGIHGYTQTFTARTLIDSVNTVSGLTADNVTWWPTSKGMYEGLQVSEGTEYGFDYPISKSNGYFVRISNFEPTDTTCKSLIWHPNGELHGQCGNN
ncbi:TPA: hypothetical protein DEP90_02280 [Patescibacteria group bacterium]|nr:hypothetical protein [Patescibacteria group bacterium]